MYITIFTIGLLLQPDLVLGTRIPLQRLRRKTGSQEVVFGEGVSKIVLVRFPYDYFGRVTIGTPKENEEEQSFLVCFDTGSPHFWITSVSACKDFECAGKKVKGFNGTKSATYKSLDTPFEITYADKTDVKGYTAMDNLKLGTAGKTIIIENQMFGMATSIKGELFHDYDGIFGLGFQIKDIMPGDPDPPFISIAKHVNIYPVLGWYLNKHFNEEGGGEITFGGYDHQLVEGELTFHDAVRTSKDWWPKHTKWAINFDKITVEKNGVMEAIYITNHFLGFIDTGTVYVHGPAVIFDRLLHVMFKDVKFQIWDRHIFRCNETWSELPNLIFTMNGVDYPLTPEDYLWPDEESYWCSCGISSTKYERGLLIGQLFMQTYYTVFDMKERRIGFGKAKHMEHWKQNIGQRDRQ